SARHQTPSGPHAAPRRAPRTCRNLLPLPAGPYRARPAGLGRSRHFRAFVMAASAAPPRSERVVAYARLARRNRIVGVLRVVVPVAGLVVFVGLALQIYVANTARQYG